MDHIVQNVYKYTCGQCRRNGFSFKEFKKINFCVIT